jgi:uracil-DNA glycosylase family 4
MSEPWSREWKEQKLYQLYEEWKNCTSCPLSKTRNEVVFGAGNPDAHLLLISEGPGEEEDATGEPFCGKSGQLLRALITNAGLSWNNLYVTNVVGCRPTDEQGANRDPSTGERDACMPRVNQILYIVDPWIVVPVGRAALKALAKGRDWAITEQHGKVFSSPAPAYRYTGDSNSADIPGKVFPKRDDAKKEVNLEYDLIPILHPSYLLREDDIDPAKGKFPSDGLTQRTFEDIKDIRRFLLTLEKEYNKIPNFERK